MTLGICDWGVGGLRLYGELRSARPDLDIVYVDDRGSETYSLLSRDALTDRIVKVLEAFRSMGIQRVIMACDSGSTVLGDIVVPGVLATGVVKATLGGMRNKPYREVGIIGGQRTILSGAYGRALRKLRFIVIQRVSLDLAQLLEAVPQDAIAIEESVQELLAPLLKVDALLLANTHYHLAASVIHSVLPRVDIIDPSTFAVAELVQELQGVEPGAGTSVFFTTGEPSEMRTRAQLLYGLKIDAKGLSMHEPKLAA
jgi:glutamate racemase